MGSGCRMYAFGKDLVLTWLCNCPILLAYGSGGGAATRFHHCGQPAHGATPACCNRGWLKDAPEGAGKESPKRANQKALRLVPVRWMS